MTGCSCPCGSLGSTECSFGFHHCTENGNDSGCEGETMNETKLLSMLTQSLSTVLWDLAPPQDILKPLHDGWSQSPSSSEMRRSSETIPSWDLKKKKISLPWHPSSSYPGNSFRVTQCVCPEQELENYGPPFAFVKFYLNITSHAYLCISYGCWTPITTS